MDAVFRRLSPTNAFGDRLENGKVFRMVDEQLPPKFERVNACLVGELIHEALDVKSVLVEIDPAPEPRRNRGDFASHGR